MLTRHKNVALVHHDSTAPDTRYRSQGYRHGWIADIGLRGTRTRNPEGGSIEGYSVFVGGKLSEAGKIAEYLCDVTSEEIVPAVKKVLDTYLANRESDDELFVDFCERVGIEQFQELVK